MGVEPGHMGSNLIISDSGAHDAVAVVEMAATRAWPKGRGEGKKLNVIKT